MLSGCVIVVGLLEQLAVVNNKPVTDLLRQVCGFIPQGEFYTACNNLIDVFGPLIIDLYVSFLFAIAILVAFQMQHKYILDQVYVS